MAEDDMYLGNLESWVCDDKKTVTYKWLSNELSVSSNVAKQMLHAFAEKKGSEVQPIYLLSGNKEGYGHTITLVAKAKLTDVKKQFNSVFSLHVYSVQAVLPKDSAHLWSVDNEQSKTLFTRPDNPIAYNRWSAIDYPEGKEKRITPGPPAAAPVQPAQTIKKEMKVKAQPKEETSDTSQPSSPERSATRRLTTTKPATGGKKSSSSPTKKQPATREMTSFFKKAPEEEKTQTLIANAKASKPKGASPSKPKLMDGFFAKKEKADTAGEAESEEESVMDVKKVKQEKAQPADTDELDELLGGEPSEPKVAKQKRKRSAAGDFAEEGMDVESKADITKRQRLRKGKRKRADDDENTNTEGEGNSRPAQVIKKEALRHDEDEEEAAAQGGKKKQTTKRRKVVQKEPEDEEAEQGAEEERTNPQLQSSKKKRTSTRATKKARKATAAKDDEPQGEEEDGEKENEGDHNVMVATKKTLIKKEKNVVERKEGVAKPVEFAEQGQRRKKKVRRERTFTDDKGFEVTEDVWEEVSDDDVPAPIVLASIKEEAANNEAATAAAAAKKKGTTQGNIMSFFGKKN